MFKILEIHIQFRVQNLRIMGQEIVKYYTVRRAQKKKKRDLRVRLLFFGILLNVPHSLQRIYSCSSRVFILRHSIQSPRPENFAAQTIFGIKSKTMQNTFVTIIADMTPFPSEIIHWYGCSMDVASN